MAQRVAWVNVRPISYVSFVPNVMTMGRRWSIPFGLFYGNGKSALNPSNLALGVWAKLLRRLHAVELPAPHP
jgi:hypothetical protein